MNMFTILAMVMQLVAILLVRSLALVIMAILEMELFVLVMRSFILNMPIAYLFIKSDVHFKDLRSCNNLTKMITDNLRTHIT